MNKTKKKDYSTLYESKIIEDYKRTPSWLVYIYLIIAFLGIIISIYFLMAPWPFIIVLTLSSGLFGCAIEKLASRHVIHILLKQNNK